VPLNLRPATSAHSLPSEFRAVAATWANATCSCASSNDLQLWKLPRSGPGLARKPSRSPGLYCIRLSRVFTSTVSWVMSCLTRLASGRLRFDQTGSTGFSSGAYAGSWKTVSQSRAAISSRIARLVWVFSPSQTSTTGPPSCWCAASGNRA
jgi:hypothetical protein